MGYDFTIGEAEIVCDVEDGLESFCSITAKPETHKNAPAFGEPTDFTNSRWPSYTSYTSWAKFIEFAKLEHAFYSNNHDIRGGHPGVFPIEKEFKFEVDKAYKRIKMLMKTIDPKLDLFDTEIGSAWARIQWLSYWTTWAFENCKKPIISNY